MIIVINFSLGDRKPGTFRLVLMTGDSSEPVVEVLDRDRRCDPKWNPCKQARVDEVMRFALLRGLLIVGGGTSRGASCDGCVIASDTNVIEINLGTLAPNTVMGPGAS